PRPPPPAASRSTFGQAAEHQVPAALADHHPETVDQPIVLLDRQRPARQFSLARDVLPPEDETHLLRPRTPAAELRYALPRHELTIAEKRPAVRQQDASGRHLISPRPAPERERDDRGPDGAQHQGRGARQR